MKRVSMLLMCLFAMMTAASLSAKAQEITINLLPGWTWISYPKAEVMDLATAFGDFTPVEGDMVKSQFGFAMYENGRWAGSLTQFTPGMGYKYYSNRTEMVSFVFGSTSSHLTVTTAEPTDITAISANSGGSVTSNDGSYIYVYRKGICWSTHPNPMVMSDFFTENGNGPDGFMAEMTDLIPNTLYYVRAYAVTQNDTFYGNELSFTTRNGILEVTTAELTDITTNSAICGGIVTDDGGLSITARGVCWSTDINPTISDSHTIDDAGMGSFYSYLTGLSASTTYYVRAYATNSFVMVYGIEQCFTTESEDGSGNAPTGAINGKFTINEDGNQVYFSQGNLQYIGSANTPYWKFAEHQWDNLSVTTGQNSSDQNVDRDLFGWGTSGYHYSGDQYNVNYQPWSTSSSTIDQDYNYFGYGPSTNMLSQDLTGSSVWYDWGVHNAISNGGNKAGIWRTLTKDEWVYVFNTRSTTSGVRYAKAKVSNKNGVILLPDDWRTSYYALSNTNTSAASFSSNIISASQWNILEQYGAVFLPAAGYRGTTSVFNVGSYGIYWSSSRVDSIYGRSYGVSFDDTSLSKQYQSSRCQGYSVRLVRPAQ